MKWLNPVCLVQTRDCEPSLVCACHSVYDFEFDSGLYCGCCCCGCFRCWCLNYYCRLWICFDLKFADSAEDGPQVNEAELHSWNSNGNVKTECCSSLDFSTFCLAAFCSQLLHAAICLQYISSNYHCT
jgi:hypothetical protein